MQWNNFRALLPILFLTSMAIFPVAITAADDTAKKVLTYKDDFSDQKKFESDCQVNNGLKFFPGIGLSSADQGGGSAIYDLQKILPGINDGVTVTLIYSGGANGPADMRGPHWSSSADGVTWKEFSVNEFGKEITFTGHFFKLFIVWKQAANPGYGYLRDFSLTIKDNGKFAETKTEPVKVDTKPAIEPTPAKKVTVSAKDYIALGVYWPWETTSCLDKATRAGKLEPFLVERLDDLATHGVNTIWTTNGPDSVEEIGLLCRLADARGIRIVVGSGWWSMQGHNNTDAAAVDMVAKLKSVWTGLEGKPRPIAFTIADEPRVSYMDVFGRYAKQVADAGIPATTVAMWGDYPSVIEKATTLPIICQDSYPFFNSPHGPRGDSSYSWYTGNIGGLVRKADAAGMVPWAMPQAYQEIWGPGKIDENGQAIVLPGGGNHWLMPTPAQIRWQTWASVALGAKGVLFFTYAVTGKPDPNAKPLTENWAYKEETSTGGPTGLTTWPDFSPGPQYRAMGTAFAEIKTMQKLLPELQAVTDDKHMARLVEGKLLAGDMVTLLKRHDADEYYIAVVASPKEGNRTLQLLLHPDVVRLQPMAGSPYPLSVASDIQPFVSSAITLEPGQGGIYKLIIKKSIEEKILASEDFSSADYGKRAVEVNGVNPEGEAGKPRVLRASHGETEVMGQEYPACGCYIVYDMHTILPKDEKPDVIRIFEYDGYGGPASNGLGVYIWGGSTLDALKPISSSMAPKKMFPLTPEMRYIKIGISFRQASAGYAGLKSWRVTEWQTINNQTEKPGKVSIQRSPEFFPLGVYWPGEYIFRTKDKQMDWEKNEEIFSTLAKMHCNTIWLTHTGAAAAETIEFATRAAKHGLYLVHSPGDMDGSVAHLRTEKNAKFMAENAVKAWENAPEPIAWGMGDEPRADYIGEMEKYVNAFKETSKQPTTLVAMAGDLPYVAENLNLSFLCSDIYPFFSTNNPNGPDNISESTEYLRTAGNRVQYFAKKKGIEWWLMGGIFQEPWGNRDIDEKGNIVYLPGAGPHFRQPSPAEVHWQNWVGLSTGARGLIHFSLLFPGTAANDPNAKPQPFGVTEKWNSEAPGGILYSDGRMTKQAEAMGESFADMAKISPILKKIEPIDSMLAYHSKGWVPPGDVVQVMRTVVGKDGKLPKKSEYYVLVVNGDMETKERDVPVNIGPEVIKAVDMLTNNVLPMYNTGKWVWEPVGPPFKQLRVNLKPGHGTFIKLEILNTEKSTVPMVSNTPRPDLPLKNGENGSKILEFSENIQQKNGAVDSLTTGNFLDMGPAAKHVNGIRNGETVYLFEMPGEITRISATGHYGNHQDGNEHNYYINYSFDGKKFQSLVAKKIKQGDGIAITGDLPVTDNNRRVWVSFGMDNGAFITFKNAEVKVKFNPDKK